jgi:GH15 family glucan-1,4-alpha-glucosidase
LCLPNFDSPSVFAKILDKDKGGHFKITASRAVNITQDYIPHTAILKTVFETKDGTFEVNDYMPRFLTSRDGYYCPPEIHRNIRVISGKPKIRIELVPKPNYGLGPADCFLKSDHVKICSTKGDYNSFYLYSNLDHKKILEGKEIVLEKHSFCVLSYHEKLESIDNDRIYVEYEKTKVYWLDWVERTYCPERFTEQVRRSAITLKLLMYQRTGAVVAAVTTSLPEIIGRERNWDYRYCWIRDAAMIVDLYARIGHIRSADDFIKFILDRMQLKHENIGVVYGINGEEKLDEIELDHLSGYENSKPIRIGNAAYKQQQNDLYGELIETIYTYFYVNQRSSYQLDEEIWTMVRSLVNRVRDTWRTPDRGIWERRGAPQHYVHSKLMNWVAMDRAVKIATMLRKENYVKNWRRLADEIKEDILKNGWNDDLKAFVMFYGSNICDAANLLMLHYGFLSPKDPRIVMTVQTYYKKLVKNGFTFRYIAEDEFGLPENAFIVCTFWMINALYLTGKEKLAREMFDNILECANHLGLFSEDIEIKTRRLTGNFPQGYSHLAFIQSALLLETDYNWSDAFSRSQNIIEN